MLVSNELVFYLPVIGSNIISVPASSFVTTSSQGQGQVIVQSQLPIQTVSAMSGTAGRIMLKVVPQAAGAQQVSCGVLGPSFSISCLFLTNFYFCRQQAV